MELRDQAAAVQSAGHLAGSVRASATVPNDVVIAAMTRKPDGTLALRARTFAGRGGRFVFTLPPDDYYVAAYVDANRDSRYQLGEPGRFYGDPTPVSVPPRVVTQITIDLNERTTEVGSPKVDDDVLPIGANIGQVAALDDPMFSAANGPRGMWRPIDFLGSPGGGLFMLQPYDASRCPVIFVHGMAGTPLDWAPAIQRLDKRFQAWVLYYPSGLRLGMVSDYFVNAVFELQRRHGFRDFAVVAHSAGGLVAHSFAQRYSARHPEAAGALRMVLTVNSPFGGMASAAFGVENSPIVVPAWFDVSPGSSFLQQLAGEPWPRRTPHYIVFSYRKEESGDGTVPLQSQLPQPFQQRAARLHGVENSHVGTLSDEGFLTFLAQALAHAVSTER
jgi:pimeloyl-ACP methyl ester carboxylesterase